MADSSGNTAARDRSPAYPIIPLKDALQRLAEFEAHFKRSGARPEKVGDAWNIKARAYADRIAAALRYYGLLDYQGQGGVRSIVVSDEGRKYLRAQQEETKRELIHDAALRPKQIAKFWNDWGEDRPANAACLDELVLKNGFSVGGARDFLKVYDETISFADLQNEFIIAATDHRGRPDDVEEMEDEQTPPPLHLPQSPSGGKERGIKIMAGERELTAGLLSKEASFRLIVTGQIGVKEIDRLIAKLNLDKEILAEADDLDQDELLG